MAVDKVKELIEKSGNNFHCKVFNELIKKGWKVSVSPYYNDNITDKPREVDLIAERPFRFKDKINHEFIHIFVRLFIECKYIPSETVFWFHNKDINSAE